jgi:hypothetical protein
MILVADRLNELRQEKGTLQVPYFHNVSIMPPIAIEAISTLSSME